MRNSKLIGKLAEELEIKKGEAAKGLKVLTDAFSRALSVGEEIRLKNFGVLAIHRYPPRRVPDPNNPGRKLNLAAQNIVKFYPSVGLKNRLKSTKATMPSSEQPSFDQDEKIRTVNQEEMDKLKIDQKEDENKDFSSWEKKTERIQNKAIKIPYIDLSKLTIPAEILSLVPEKIARRYKVMPIEHSGDELVLAMTDPEDEEALGIIRKQTGMRISPKLCTTDDLNQALNQYSSVEGEVKDIAGLEIKEEKQSKKVKDEDISEKAPASKIVYSLIKKAVRMQASDIHIEPEEKEVAVRFRVDGMLQKILSLPKTIQDAVTSRLKILSGMKIDETRLPQDGRFQTIVDQREVDFRVSDIPTVNGEKIVARILDKSAGILSLEDLGLRGEGYKALEDNIKKSHGMILVTGPTGSGKTTTLYAVVKKIYSETINITTLEDPVEYRLKGINQSQVNSAIGFTFAGGLRSLVRQDPDVIMIGEIRDFETAEMAVHSALTGHIVLSTLHTNDAAGAIPRLIDMKVEPFLISSSVNVIVAQRLCRKICQECKQKIKTETEHKNEIEKAIQRLKEAKLELPKNQTDIFAGKGCQACGDKGYKGRIGIFEVLEVTEKVKDLAIAKASASKIMEAALGEKMVTMNEDGILKVLDGLTTMEEVWRATRD